ncbi:lymphotactin [Moschus berezovskii]|uniref:lymphotactin n=1 Tax=Moschus berezovskii TaxID=68408 RepID=UPI0024446CBE|nr:lymphotactin [Moschus berezovskii]
MRLLILTCLGICSLAAYTVEGVGSEVLEKSICVSLTAQRLPIKNINRCNSVIYIPNKLSWSLSKCDLIGLPLQTTSHPGVHHSLRASDLRSTKYGDGTNAQSYIHLFITRRGIKICADPQADWVKKAVQTIDRRNMSQTKPTATQQTTNTAATLTE